eukprot:TRINITY_DN93154_c0_g1_i1.p2 TRINITY_DN93154_c0_g1~~TRINITY_DN93154_c0_g1_i1.p2  ORF type:complete len:269 (-),score=48.80 TRINITY_DN93154_c0_g1_i1:37-843(-)
MDIVSPGRAPAQSEAQAVAVHAFGTLTDSMLTLLQVLTLDSVGQIYRPLIRGVDTSTAFVNALYFVLYILLVSVALMNLVTAVMVEGSVSQAAQDQEFFAKMECRRKTQLLPELLDMFEHLDEDGSEEISLQELMDAPRELKERLIQIIGTDDPAEMFHVLDMDDSGTLKTDEFMLGLMKSAQGATMQEFRMNKVLRQVDMMKQILLDGKSIDEVEQTVEDRRNARWTNHSATDFSSGECQEIADRMRLSRLPSQMSRLTSQMSGRWS